MNNFEKFGYDYPLIITKLLTRSMHWAPDEKIIYRDKFECTYSELFMRIQKLANLYTKIGIKYGDTIGVMDWDSHRYLEHYFAVPMIGAVLHTINNRLSPEQILYTINDAEDKVLIVNKDFFPIINSISSRFKSVKNIIVIKDWGEFPESNFDYIGEYEKLLTNQDDDFAFPQLDENTIATMFYTTGTTGNPKGVYFSHRQIVLHTMSGLAGLSAFTDPVSFSYKDVYMPLTPMFHVHAWGVPYMATLMGNKQIYPGRYEPDMLLKLIATHKVTFSHCVPSILQMLLSSSTAADFDLSNLKLVIGGSALSRGLAKSAIERDIKIAAGYGLSESCPILTIAHLKKEMLEDKTEKKLDIITCTGFPIPLVEMKIVDPFGEELPKDANLPGEIIVRSPWLTAGYFKSPTQSGILWKDNWLHTGDIAKNDDEGYFKITDRIKDIIKSGGEWISSLELENIISQFEEVQNVAVIGVPDPKWGERPMAYIVLKPEVKERKVTPDFSSKLMDFVKTGKINKWAIPDKFILIDDIPKTSVGKISKKELRGLYQRGMGSENLGV